MEENLDQLFRNKLSGHKVNPSAESWEKLESQLSWARWGRTQKRLAVAASLMLLMSVVGVAYYYLGTQKNVENPVLSENVEPDFGNTEVNETPVETQVTVNPTEQLIETDANISNTQAFQVAEAEQLNNQSESVQQPTALLVENVTVESNDSPLMVAVINETPLNDASTTIEGQDVMNAETTPEAMLIEEEPLAVTIIYKANKNSKLVTPQKVGVIQEGIEKITGFAEELVKPEEIKTKLRNTTGDLLALNFGKLINKPNKEE